MSEFCPWLRKDLSKWSGLRRPVVREAWETIFALKPPPVNLTYGWLSFQVQTCASSYLCNEVTEMLENSSSIAHMA